MWILPLVGYLGLVLGFLFLTLAIASGLYYLSELVEEHTVFTKRLLTRMIYTIIVIQILLWALDGFPLGLSIIGIISHVVYMQNLRRFPVVKLTDPVFLLSCALVVTNHYLWFRHFASPPSPQQYNPYETSGAELPTFTEISSYFGLCVWLVPFALFVSLSAGENVLPSMGSEYATGEGSSYLSPGKEPGSASLAGSMGAILSGGGSRSRAPATDSDGIGPGGGVSTRRKTRPRSGTNTGMAKAVVTGVREWVGETGELLGLWKGEKTRPF